MASAHKINYGFIAIATSLIFVGIAVLIFGIINGASEPIEITPRIIQRIESGEIAAVPISSRSMSLTAEILRIPENITQEDAKQALDLANEIVSELARQGFSNLYVRDKYLEAKQAFEGENITKILAQINSIQNLTKRNYALSLLFGAKQVLNSSNLTQEKVGNNYTKVFEYAIDIQKRQQETYNLADAIKVLEFVVVPLNRSVINFSEVDAQFLDIRKKFKNEQFEGLLDLINSTYKKIDQTIVESTRARAIYKASKRTLIDFVGNNYKALIISASILLVAGLILFNELRIISLSKKVISKETEKKILFSLIKKAQVEYFTDGKISKRMYDSKIKQYREKIAKINAGAIVTLKNIEKKEGYRSYYVFDKNKIHFQSSQIRSNHLKNKKEFKKSL